jgi:L-seryl-tRNA(Ser) seleniumtransferase
VRQSGAKMVEVGTTNRTYLEDYEQAITPRTVALLRVHSSNFKIIGFTSSVSLEDLVELGRKYDLPVLDDLGSGCFIDTASFGLDAEPKVQDCVALGASLVFFSGDKLLGGPQAGIIVGRRDFIEKMKKHPLARAVRIDKVRIAGLAATLVHYLTGEALEKIPILRMIATPLEDLEKRAEKWASFLGKSATVTPGESTVGGGSLPESTLPTRLVSIKLKGAKIHDLAQNLRQHRPAIIGRVGQNSLLLDPRCVLPEEEDTLLEAVRDELASLGDSG